MAWASMTTSTTIGATTGRTSIRTPRLVRTRRASRRASTMPSRATHHNEEANSTTSNCSAENGRAVALAHRNCTCPPKSVGGADTADLMSGSIVSIPITDWDCAAYWNVNRPSPAPTSRTRASRKPADWRMTRGITRAGSMSVGMTANCRTRSASWRRSAGDVPYRPEIQMADSIHP